MSRALALAALTGCTVGGGEGFVVGEIDLPGCDDLDGDGFDLGADFFAGEPFEDSGENEQAARDTLTLRIQHSAGNTDVVDGLTIQVLDLDEVEAGAPEDVSPGCLDPASCPVRATLSLFLTCPDVYSALVASGATGCPAGLDAASLCGGDYAARDPYRGLIEDAIPDDAACLVLCELGDEFEEVVSAAFRMRLIDDRADEARGWIEGRFRFDLARGRAGQSFP